MKHYLKKYAFSILLIVGLVVGGTIWHFTSGYDDKIMADIPRYDEDVARSILEDEDIQSLLEPSVFEYYNVYNYELEATDAEEFHLTIDSRDYSAISEEQSELVTGLEEPYSEAIALLDQDGWVEYTVDVPEDGYYQLGVDYYALPGKRSD